MDRSRMKSLKVTTIRHYKEKLHGEHEYLVAEVSVPDLGSPRYLRIERSVDPLPIRSSLPPISTTSSQSSLVALKSSVVVSKELPACDNVKTVEEWPTSGDICLYDINCKNTSIILLDLAIVAKSVYDHMKKYHIIKSQCFWYSDAIIAILQKNFSGIQVVHRSRDPSVEADHAKMEYFDELGGTVNSIHLYQRRESVIREINEAFVSYRPLVYSLVCFLNTCIFLLINHYVRSGKPLRLK